MAEIIFYTTAKGNSEVDSFIQALDEKASNGDRVAAKQLDSIV
ncbi:hypothetical protein [Paenibacillus jiagnxiensis]